MGGNFENIIDDLEKSIQEELAKDRPIQSEPEQATVIKLPKISMEAVSNMSVADFFRMSIMDLLEAGVLQHPFFHQVLESGYATRCINQLHETGEPAIRKELTVVTDSGDIYELRVFVEKREMEENKIKES
jgi:hypothetical protein